MSKRVLFARIIKSEEADKLTEACSKTINYLRKSLHLKKWESYVVVKTLFQEFPLEDLDDMVEYTSQSDWK